MKSLAPRMEIVSSEQAALRLDRYLASWTEIQSRSRAAQLIDDGCVQVNGKAAKASLILKSGDQVLVRFPDVKASELAPYALDLDVVHEDEDLLVVNKPAGLVVHPAAGHASDTLVNALIAQAKNLSMGFGENRPGIVHRLDKETSGLLVVAKNDRTQESLAQQFKAREILRSYQAVAFGVPLKEQGSMTSWLARHPVDRKRFASVLGSDRNPLRDPDPESPAGKWAVTNFRKLKSQHQLTLFELKLETGRTHQIRVHLSEMGHPLVGDSLYGADRKLKSLPSTHIRNQIQSLDRFLLHARELGFKHPSTSKDLHFHVDWPAPDLALLKEWGLR